MNDTPTAARSAVNEYLSGDLSRRGFVRRMALLGFGVAVSSTILAACGEEDTSSSADNKDPVAGGRLREGYDKELTAPDNGEQRLG